MRARNEDEIESIATGELFDRLGSSDSRKEFVGIDLDSLPAS